MLRVGNTNAVVELPAASSEEVLRVSFDLWVGNLIKRFIIVELQNEAGERVAGFKLNRYDGTLEYNDFNNDANEGLDLLAYVTSVGSKGTDNAAIHVDSNKSSFDLIVDYKNNTIKGLVANGKNGTCNGAALPMPANVEDTNIVKFVLSSTYDNADRRSWFDNLKAYKYKPTGAANGIQEMTATKAADKGIYNLQGVKMNGSSLPAGLYIINGKKYVVK